MLRVDAETDQHGALCTPGNPITRATRTSPQTPEATSVLWYARLAPRPGDTVIDVGCGPGLNFAALHAAVGPHGTIIAIDESPQLFAVAAHQVTRRR
jgi:precorrin-6B methylase 2